MKKLKKVKVVRVIQGFTQRDVFAQSGIQNYRLSLIENGHVEPSAEELEALAKALGTTVEILSDEDEKGLESLIRSQQVA